MGGAVFSLISGRAAVLFLLFLLHWTQCRNPFLDEGQRQLWMVLHFLSFLWVVLLLLLFMLGRAAFLPDVVLLFPSRFLAWCCRSLLSLSFNYMYKLRAGREALSRDLQLILSLATTREHLFTVPTRDRCRYARCVCVPLHNAESAPGAFQWHGQTPVSAHFPSEKLESTGELCFGEKKEFRQEWAPVRSA